jgi:adenine phosphoribosyltransferase
VLIIDDVLATGGTASAAAQLVRECGAAVVAIATVIELSFLEPRKKLEGVTVHTLVQY